MPSTTRAGQAIGRGLPCPSACWARTVPADRLGLAAEAGHGQGMAEWVDRGQDGHRVAGPKRHLEPGPQGLDGRHVLPTGERSRARGQEPERAEYSGSSPTSSSPSIASCSASGPVTVAMSAWRMSSRPSAGPRAPRRGEMTLGERQRGRHLARLEQRPGVQGDELRAHRDPVGREGVEPAAASVASSPASKAGRAARSTRRIARSIEPAASALSIASDSRPACSNQSAARSWSCRRSSVAELGRGGSRRRGGDSGTSALRHRAGRGTGWLALPESRSASASSRPVSSRHSSTVNRSGPRS